MYRRRSLRRRSRKAMPSKSDVVRAGRSLHQDAHRMTATIESLHEAIEIAQEAGIRVDPRLRQVGANIRQSQKDVLKLCNQMFRYRGPK